MYFVVILFVYLSSVDGYRDLKCSEGVCLPKNYSKFKLPSEARNEIGVSLDIDQVLSIDDSTTSIKLSMFFNVEWNDKRMVLSPENGWKRGEMKPFSNDFVEDLWLPNIFIYNLQSFEVMKVLSKLSGLWINSDKKILYSQAATITYYCPMDFKNFPLDSHSCILKLGSYSYNDEKMPFSTKSYGFSSAKSQPLSLQYWIGNINFRFSFSNETKLNSSTQPAD